MGNSYNDLKAPGQCVVDEQVKSTHARTPIARSFGTLSDKDERARIAANPDMVSMLKEADLKANAEAKKLHKPPVSRCVF